MFKDIKAVVIILGIAGLTSLPSTSVLAGSLTVDGCGGINGTNIDAAGMQFWVFNNNDLLAQDHSELAYPGDTFAGDIQRSSGPKTVSCDTGTCIVKTMGYRHENKRWLEGSHSGNMYLKIVDDDVVAYSDNTTLGCSIFKQPNTGFVMGLNAAQCIQKADSGMYAGVHMWDKCDLGNPPTNRHWRYSESRIRVADDPSRCLTVDSKPPDGVDKMGVPYYFPEPRSGDKVFLKDCLMDHTIQDVEYNPKGQHQIRLLAFPTYCVYRAGNNNGDGLYVDLCDAGNANGQWNISW